jgi:SdrD B-like domain/Malectin domain/Putative Ig domain
MKILAPLLSVHHADISLIDRGVDMGGQASFSGRGPEARLRAGRLSGVLLGFGLLMLCGTVGAQSISGTVFLDGNSNGTKDVGEAGFPFIAVRAYDATNTVVATMETQGTPAANLGQYTLSGLTAGTPYRIEFTTPNGYFDGASGMGNSSVRFATGGATGVDFGLYVARAPLAGVNPALVFGCARTAGSSDPGVASYLYNERISLSTYNVYAAHTGDALLTQVGVPWAFGVRNPTKHVFFTSITSPRTDIYPAAPDGPSALYMADYSGTAGPRIGNAYVSTKLLVKLADLGVDVTNQFPVFRSAGNTDPIGDETAHVAFGLSGLGGIDVTDDGKTLLVINMGAGTLVRLDISGTVYGSLPVTAPAAATTIAIPTGVTGTVGGRFRPSVVKVVGGTAYIGGVSDGSLSTAANVRVTVLAYDIASGSFFKAFEFTPNFLARHLIPGLILSQGIWEYYQLYVPGTFQPVLADIGFDDEGAMLIGVMNRRNYGVIANNDLGYVVRAARTSTGWDLESAGVSGPYTTQADEINTYPDNHPGNDYRAPNGPSGPGNKWFFEQSLIQNGGAVQHGAGFNGGIFVCPNTGRFVAGWTDPQSTGQFGARYFDWRTGQTKEFVLLGGQKVFAISSLDGIYPANALEIGNRVWRDTNHNGIQDPAEPPVAGVTVALCLAGNPTALATTTTDSNGCYIFSGAAGTSTGSTQYNLSLTPSTQYVVKVTALGVDPSATGLTLTGLSSSTPGESAATNTGLTLANNDAKLVSGLPTIVLTTGNAGENNHSYDIGFIGSAACAITDLAFTGGAGTCNDNGTPAVTTDDWFLSDVTVTFANKPATGNLVLTGAALHGVNTVTTVAVASTTSATTHTFVGVKLKANNTANALIATFSADIACTYTENTAAVPPCSVPPVGHTPFGLGAGTVTGCDLAQSFLAVPYFINGDPLPDTPATTDSGDGNVLVRFPYLSAGDTTAPGYVAPTGLATGRQVGAVNGLAYAAGTDTLYAAAFLKRHVGLGPNGLGAIYKITGAKTASPTVSLFVDFVGLGINVGQAAVPDNVTRDLVGTPATNSVDADVLPLIGKAGFGDMEISADGSMLFVTNLHDKRVYAVRVDADSNPATAPVLADIGSCPLPAPHAVTPRPLPPSLRYDAGSVATTGTPDLADRIWNADFVFGRIGTPTTTTGTYTNLNNSADGTSTSVVYRSYLNSATVGYTIPVPNGGYDVVLHFAEPDTAAAYTTAGPRRMDISIEGSVVQSAFEPYAAAGNTVKAAVTRRFSTTVADNSLTVSLAGLAGRNAILNGIEIITTSLPAAAATPDVLRPFGLKWTPGALYVGAVSTAETSLNPADLNGYVYRYDGSAFSEVLAFPLSYAHGGANRDTLPTPAAWQPWDDVAEPPYRTLNNISDPQAIISGLEIDGTGALIIGITDRSGHQWGKSNTHPNGANVRSLFSAGDILRATPSGASFTLESNGTAGANTSAGAGNGQGPGGGEFYVADSFLPFEETSLGSLAYIPGTTDVVMTSLTPFALSQGGIKVLSNVNGSQSRAYTIYTTTATGTFGNASSLGDLEVLCTPALPCAITDLAFTGGAGTCNDNGSPGFAFDDYFVSDVTVTFANKPTTGNLVLSGAALHSANTVTTVAVSSIASTTTYVFTGVKLKADNVANSLTATFSDYALCAYTESAPAVPACNTLPAICLVTKGKAVMTCHVTTTVADPAQRFVMAIADTRQRPASYSGQTALGVYTNLWMPSAFHHPDWIHSKMGNIFGLAMDCDCNIYVTAIGQTPPVGTYQGIPGFGSLAGFDPAAPTSTASVQAGGAIYKIDAHSGVPTLLTKLPQQLMSPAQDGNNAPGLGQVAYDHMHRQLFVSNLEDGKIYRLSLAGSTLQVYDPGTADDGSAGRAPLTEIVWALSVNKAADRLFFSINRNDVHHVTLDATGAITGTSTNLNLGIAQPSVHSNFLTDIAFNQANTQVILAQRTVNSIFNAYNHSSASFIYDYDSATHAFTLNRTLQVGDDTEAYGGAAYAPLNTDPVTEVCTGVDQMLWFSSADILDATGPHGLYALPVANLANMASPAIVNYGSSVSGFTGQRSNTLYVIYYDGNLATDSKGSGGDIDIYGGGLDGYCPPLCSITDLAFTGGAGTCNDNGTPAVTTDDYFLSDVTVTFANKPATGNLALTGAALHSTNTVTTVAVGSTTSATTHTFIGVRLKANTTANALIATFSADALCTYTENTVAVPPCSCPTITITPATLPAGAVGTVYQQTPTASGAPGGAAYTWSATGLPAGLGINTSTGAITGTPTAPGTATLTATYTSGSGQVCMGTASLTVVSNCCPRITIMVP